MRALGETRFGIFQRGLVESALARPQQAAIYENADLSQQAATLMFGLIKNHPFVGGNKRTASLLTLRFLQLNNYMLQASSGEHLRLVLAIEANEMKVDEVAEWMRARISPRT